MFEMKMHAQKLSKETGMEIALARTPAETTAQRFAVSDLLHKEYADKAEFTIKGNLEAAKSELNQTHGEYQRPEDYLLMLTPPKEMFQSIKEYLKLSRSTPARTTRILMLSGLLVTNHRKRIQV